MEGSGPFGRLMDIELLRARSGIITRTRFFFDSRSYLSLDTPSLSPSLIPESCLEIFKTEYVSPSEPAKTNELYLVPSPEIWIKKIISAHKCNVYEICKCFRNCESLALAHSPEFTMLEYYTMNAGYLESLALTEELFDFLLDAPFIREFIDDASIAALRPPFERLSMNDAFIRHARFDLNDAIRCGTMREHALRLGLNPARNLNDAALYNLIFIAAVEPKLRGPRPVAVLDYPSVTRCLAKTNGGAGETEGVAERWELYVNGIETANCYSEETDLARIKKYYEDESAEKSKNARVPHRVGNPEDEMSALPRCSGTALGMDRLIMILTGKKTIDAVLPFGTDYFSA